MHSPQNKGLVCGKQVFATVIVHTCIAAGRKFSLKTLQKTLNSSSLVTVQSRGGVF